LRTESGISRDDKDKQPEKHSFPIEINIFGMIIDNNEEH
jgi:hypothetical protein